MRKHIDKRLRMLERRADAIKPPLPCAKTPIEFVEQERAWLQEKGPQPLAPDFIAPLMPVWDEQVALVRRHYPGVPDPAVHPDDAAAWRKMIEGKKRADESWRNTLEQIFPNGIPAELLDD